MMKIKYNSFEDRQAKSKEIKELNRTTGTTWRMTSDNFTDPGDPQIGVMTFTDEPEPVAVDPIKEEFKKATPERKQQMIAERLGLV